MAFTLPTVDASKTVEDLGAFSLGSIHTVAPASPTTTSTGAQFSWEASRQASR